MAGEFSSTITMAETHYPLARFGRSLQPPTGMNYPARQAAGYRPSTRMKMPSVASVYSSSPPSESSRIPYGGWQLSAAVELATVMPLESGFAGVGWFGRKRRKGDDPKA